MGSGGTSTPSDITSAPSPLERHAPPHALKERVHFSWRGDREEHLVSGLSKKQKGMRERAGEEGGHATSGVGGGGLCARARAAMSPPTPR